MTIGAYLFFNGRCEEAIAFYCQALGAEQTALMRWKDNPDMAQPGMLPPGSENKVMHAELRIAGSTLMVSDGMASDAASFKGFALTLDPPDAAAAEKTFNALADGGKVNMPLGKTFWSPCFGMLTDRFGVDWMISVNPPAA